MTLTVPFAGTDAGRAARPVNEAPQTGNVIAAFGNQLKQVGDRLENDRLDREMGRLQVDMTKDLNDLRLQAESIGDPDQLDSFWQNGIAQLKQSYQTGQTEAGRPRVDPKIRDKWELGFDDLANRHAFAIGQNSLALRQSQRMATFADYEHVAGQQAALTDPGTRDQLYATYDEQVDGQVAERLMSPEFGAAKKREFRAAAESGNLTYMVNEDPVTARDVFDAGAVGANLTAEDRAKWSVKIDAAIATKEEKAKTEAEVKAKEVSAKVAANLKTGIAVAGKGQFSAFEGLSDDPAVIAEHPDLAAELRETIALRDQGKNIATMSLPDLRALSSDLGKQELTADWQVKRKEVVDQRIAAAEKGFGEGGDQIAYAKGVGLPVPELDLTADGQTLAQGLAARRAYGEWLKSKGYTEAPALLSEAERAALTERIGEKTDPTQRIETVLAMTAGLDRDGALSVAKSIGASAGFTRAIGLVADGADPTVALPILRGEQKLAEKVASAPPAKQAQMVFSEVTGSTLDGSVPAMSEIYQSAAAIFADGMGATDPEEMAAGLLVDGPARTKWASAIQQAAGATPDRNGEMTVGGFQSVAGQTLLLPRGIPSETANRAVVQVAGQLSGLDIYAETGTVKFSDIQPKARSPKLPLAPFDPAMNIPRANADGSVSTEITMTSEAPDGGFWNVPSLWWKEDGTSVELPEQQALALAKRYEETTGQKFPRFGTLKDAEAAAQTRSAQGGGQARMITAPPKLDIYRGLKAASLKPGAYPDLGENPAEAWQSLRIERIEGPVGQDAYVLVGERRGIPFYAEDVDGKTYAFSLEKLIDGARR
jgi:hypothetical protein